jgi:hypothetical protein
VSPKLFLPILILIPLIALVLIFKSGLNPNSTAKNPPKSDLTLDSLLPTPDSSVTVAVNFLPSQSDPQTIAFEVILNTHSVDLDDIDFLKSVVLETSGQKFSPIEVKTEDSGHHRSATVKFTRVSPPAKVIFLKTDQIAGQEFEFKQLDRG